MKLTSLSSLIGTIAVLAGCRTPSNQLQNEWASLYQGDPSLVQIVATQYPENPYERKGYAGRHPAVITYTFQDKTQRVIAYLPDGGLIADYRVDQKGKLMK